jgi:hypothetical protein
MAEGVRAADWTEVNGSAGSFLFVNAGGALLGAVATGGARPAVGRDGIELGPALEGTDAGRIVAVGDTGTGWNPCIRVVEFVDERIGLRKMD